MRYTEAKQLIAVLKENDWFKIKGIPGEYRKYWTCFHGNETHQYAQMLHFDQIRETQHEIELLLEDCEYAAKRAFEERFGVPVEPAGTYITGKLVWGRFNTSVQQRRW